MSDKHFSDIVSRVVGDTGIDSEVIETICRCFLYELAEEMIQRTVELPYIGDLSYRNKKIDSKPFMKDLKNKGGSYAIKFRRKHADTIKRSTRACKGSSNSSE